MPPLSDQSSGLIDREDGADVVVPVVFRRSALEALKGEGLHVEGTMQLVENASRGALAIVIWSAEMPDWPDPVPGNAAAAAEREERCS